jgi:hypothetical protein
VTAILYLSNLLGAKLKVGVEVIDSQEEEGGHFAALNYRLFGDI